MSLFDALAGALDADRLLQRTMAGLIETAKLRYPVDPGAQWRPGSPLKLLLAGYSGTRNTGADVRVEEMIRQFRHLLGDDHLDLSILTLDPAKSRGYFRTVKQLHLPQLFPKFLFDAVHRVHGVVACEGSMFKSKFANALSTMMVGSLGLASAEMKLAIGYGGEAGAMDPSLERLVKRYCRDALILTRNRESQGVLARLGVRSKPGTDTAWTFEPAPPAAGEALLKAAGWDGRRTLLVVCPINPFWWPVKPDLVKGAMHALAGMHDDSHYESVYFHNAGSEVDRKQRVYLDAIASAVDRYRKKSGAFVAVVGMEALDREACEGLGGRLGGAPVFVSDRIDMYEMVSLLRQASLLVASRYHAVVTSMPGGVPSAGITMDERIRNLMADRGQPELAMGVEDEDLEERLHETLWRLHRDADGVRAGIAACVEKNLVRMGEMGIAFVEHVRAAHPRLPIRAGLGEGGDPWAHLPPLPQAVVRMLAHAAAGRDGKRHGRVA